MKKSFGGEIKRNSYFISFIIMFNLGQFVFENYIVKLTVIKLSRQLTGINFAFSLCMRSMRLYIENEQNSI